MANVWVALDWVGRIGVSALFVKAGVNHIRKRQAMMAYVQSKHLPLAWLDVVGTGVMMLVGSALLVANWHPHWGAALIILFLVPTAFLMHNYWARPTRWPAPARTRNSGRTSRSRSPCCSTSCRGICTADPRGSSAGR